jgi:hypothetical protein
MPGKTFMIATGKARPAAIAACSYWPQVVLFASPLPCSWHLQ